MIKSVIEVVKKDEKEIQKHIDSVGVNRGKDIVLNKKLIKDLEDRKVLIYNDFETVRVISLDGK